MGRGDGSRVHYTDEQSQCICDLKVDYSWKEITKKYNKLYPEAPRTMRALELHYSKNLKGNSDFNHREPRSGSNDPESDATVCEDEKSASSHRRPLGDATSRANVTNHLGIDSDQDDTVEFCRTNDEVALVGQSTGGAVVSGRRGHELRQKHDTVATLRAERTWVVYQTVHNQEGASEPFYETRRLLVKAYYEHQQQAKPVDLYIEDRSLDPHGLNWAGSSCKKSSYGQLAEKPEFRQPELDFNHMAVSIGLTTFPHLPLPPDAPNQLIVSNDFFTKDFVYQFMQHDRHVDLCCQPKNLYAIMFDDGPNAAIKTHWLCLTQLYSFLEHDHMPPEATLSLSCFCCRATYIEIAIANIPQDAQRVLFCSYCLADGDLPAVPEEPEDRSVARKRLPRTKFTPVELLNTCHWPMMMPTRGLQLELSRFPELDFLTTIRRDPAWPGDDSRKYYKDASWQTSSKLLALECEPCRICIIWVRISRQWSGISDVAEWLAIHVPDFERTLTAYIDRNGSPDYAFLHVEFGSPNWVPMWVPMKFDTPPFKASGDGDASELNTISAVLMNAPEGSKIDIVAKGVDVLPTARANIVLFNRFWRGVKEHTLSLIVDLPGGFSESIPLNAWSRTPTLKYGMIIAIRKAMKAVQCMRERLAGRENPRRGQGRNRA